MIHKFFLVFTAVLIASGPALAQARLERDCTLQRDLIFEIMRAEYGAYSVWDSLYGEMNTDERFVSGVVLDSGNAVTAGEVGTFGKPDVVLKLAEFDNRGRVLWETTHTAPGLTSVKKILKTSMGYTVAGVTKDKNAKIAVWLGFFTRDGKFREQKTINGKGSLIPDDIIVQTGSDNLLLAAAEGSEKTGIFQGTLYHLNAKGDIVDRHAYHPGLDNRLLSLEPEDKDFYIASGYLRGEDGRLAGWILKFNRDGSLVWQQEFPRGASAKVNRAIPYQKNYIITAGETVPLNQGTKAGWVMMIDSNTGDMIWQRYYTSADMDQAARDVIADAGGLISVMMSVTKPEGVAVTEDNEDYVRLLTINERGILVVSDEYFNGTGAQAGQLFAGKAGERIITGRTDIVYKIEPKPGDPVETLKHGWDAWVLAAPAPEPFNDPCLNINPFMP